MHEAVAAIAATGVSPIVRIAANEGWMVKREFIFDSGERIWRYANSG
jgi:4-hydroxy-2-oxoheptanedioate aldolase